MYLNIFVVADFELIEIVVPIFVQFSSGKRYLANNRSAQACNYSCLLATYCLLSSKGVAGPDPVTGGGVLLK